MEASISLLGLGLPLRKTSLSQSRGPGHMIGLQEILPTCPYPLFSVYPDPYVQRSKGAPSRQKQPKWTGTGQASGTFTQAKKKKKKKKLAYPFQARGSQSTWLKSRAYSMGSQLPASLISTATELHWTLRPTCAFPSFLEPKSLQASPPMPLLLQIQWGKDIKLMSRRGVSIFLGLESFPTNREGTRKVKGKEEGRGWGRDWVSPRERTREGWKRKQDSIQFLLTLCPSYGPPNLLPSFPQGSPQHATKNKYTLHPNLPVDPSGNENNPYTFQFLSSLKLSLSSKSFLKHLKLFLYYKFCNSTKNWNLIFPLKS